MIHFFIRENMENKIRLLLPKKFSEMLEEFPEQGMGCQIVDVYLNNGNLLSNKFVFNSNILELDKSEKIEVENIAFIKPTRNR